MHDKAFTFQTLRPDTIIDGLFDLGMRVDSGLTPLNSYENRVYQFQDEERHRYVVKFYRPERWSAEQILEEHQFALQLVEDEVPVAAPLLFNDSTLHQHQGFYFAVFPSLGGRQFEADNLDQMEWVGCYLGNRRVRDYDNLELKQLLDALLPARQLASRSTCWNRVRCLSRRR